MKALYLWAVVLVAVVLAAFSLAGPATQLGWHLAGRVTATAEPLRTPAGGDAGAGATGSVNAIQALAPFGSSAPAPASPDSGDVSDIAGLGLTLRGVLVDSDASRSRAFIARNGRTSAYLLGDDVAEGVLLTEIAGQYVILSRGGAQLRLSFTDAVAEPGTEEVAAQDAETLDPMARLRDSLVKGRGSLDLREAPPPEDIDGYIDLWRERIIRNPDAVLETIGLEPSENGYTITENPNIGVTLAGLRSGDVVTRVNGQQVGDPQRDRILYDEVAASGFARLEIVREGRTMMMSFPLR